MCRARVYSAVLHVFYNACVASVFLRPGRTPLSRSASAGCPLVALAWPGRHGESVRARRAGQGPLSSAAPAVARAVLRRCWWPRARSADLPGAGHPSTPVRAVATPPRLLSRTGVLLRASPGAVGARSSCRVRLSHGRSARACAPRRLCLRLCSSHLEGSPCAQRLSPPRFSESNVRGL